MSDIQPYIRLEYDPLDRFGKVNICLDPRFVFFYEAHSKFGSAFRECLQDQMTLQTMKDLMMVVDKLYHECHHESLLQPMIVGQPVYDHDCEKCIFLGHLYQRDLYFCQQNGLNQTTVFPTIISRWSSEPSEYTSGLGFAENSPDIWIGAVLAQERGLGKFLESRKLIIAGDAIHYV